MRPRSARAMLVLGPGAGAPMTHPFLNSLASELAIRRIATLRYNFPYKERGGKRPDREPVLLDTVCAAIETARELPDRLPLFAGGKSMGGRMTSRALANRPVKGVCGLVFFGFPLHQAGKPAIRRAVHLGRIDKPMIFLQGSRDRLADPELMKNVSAELGDLAVLHVIEGADHSFATLKRSGISAEQVITELADTAANWVGNLVND